MPSNHLILCRPLLLLPSILPSIRVSSDESVLHIRWPKYWSFSFSISPSNEYSGLISFRMDWLDQLDVQGIFKCLLQYHSSKASILRHSAFFIVQLSHPYMTTEKTIGLTRWTFAGKVMSYQPMSNPYQPKSSQCPTRINSCPAHVFQNDMVFPLSAQPLRLWGFVLCLTFRGGLGPFVPGPSWPEWVTARPTSLLHTHSLDYLWPQIYITMHPSHSV